MRFALTDIEGALIVDLDVQSDERGGFARIYCGEEFAAEGIDFRPMQVNLSRNTACHTLRGLHTQDARHAEAKLVQCVRGRIFDVAVDVRPGSPTHGNIVTVDLTASNNRLFYIPPGCAHGFLTLAADSDLIYYMGTVFIPGVGIGFRWDDPAFAIEWPARPAVISARDATYPDFVAATR